MPLLQGPHGVTAAPVTESTPVAAQGADNQCFGNSFCNFVTLQMTLKGMSPFF